MGTIHIDKGSLAVWAVCNGMKVYEMIAITAFQNGKKRHEMFRKGDFVCQLAREIALWETRQV